MTLSNPKRSIYILFDSSRGQYMPQQFAHSSYLELFPDINDDDIEVLKRGPEDEEYWDAWNSVMDAAAFETEDGSLYYLHQDGDLFLVCPERMSECEYENFYGVARPREQ